LTAGHGARFGTIPAGDKVRIVFLDSVNNVSEIAYVTAISGDTATIARGQDGTVGAVHLAGDRIEHRLGKSSMEAMTQFPPNTRMLFNQTAAPTGWTKDTTAALNDSALRIVTGAVASGGSLAFSAAFAAGRVVSGTTDGFAAGGTVNSGGNGTSGATTLSVAQMPSHTHKEQHAYGGGGVAGVSGVWGSGSSTPSYNYTIATGGNGSHTHTTPAHSHSFTGTAHSHTLASSSLAMNVKYTDLIIATKD